ncbi:hypothetical protein PanWU01x14_034410 [Parasponia andersonii]|uniref:Uncharacterized protein n=1 Tax=Parasponia andersonii TaxID=3476 RepID=A0A2P5DSW8_PARAD|nr:hypothetical protein PanWU01x14_034410 [Parasponia andersonii]
MLADVTQGSSNWTLKLTWLQKQQPTQQLLEEEASTQLEILEIWESLESIWKQKSREDWLKEGDQNTKFFHASTVVRRKRNHILAIEKNNGDWLRCRATIGNYLNENFTNLFTLSNPVISEELEVLIDSSITAEENAELCRLPTYDEVKTIV